MQWLSNTKQEHRWDVTDFTALEGICFQAWEMLTQFNGK